MSLRNQVNNTREWCSNSQTGVLYSAKVTIGETLCKLDCHVSYAMQGAQGPSPLLTGSEARANVVVQAWQWMGGGV